MSFRSCYRKIVGLGSSPKADGRPKCGPAFQWAKVGTRSFGMGERSVTRGSVPEAARAFHDEPSFGAARGNHVRNIVHVGRII